MQNYERDEVEVPLEQHAAVAALPEGVEAADIVVVHEPVEQAAEPQPPAHIMLDLETWGTGNEAVIVSIGACKFNEDEIIDQFHVGVDPASCQAFGLDIDAETVLWWMSPDRREALDDWLKLERIDLPSALLGFELWAKSGPGILSIWGNGSTFDNVILRSAYKATGQSYPVRFWQDACYRTVKNRTAIAIERVGTHHNALDDAVSQAKHLQAIWREQGAAGDHLVKLQEQARRYLEPTPHYSSFASDSSDVIEGEPETQEQRDQAFINDMIYLLDGPEQRAVQA